MKPGDKKPPHATDAAGARTPRNWTSARLASLTGSQVKELLLVASEADLQSAATPDKRAADVERLLAEMSRSHEGSRSDLLQTATQETTSVDELIRIKELAKVLIKDAVDNRQREVARLLYHVAVATASVHHTAAISGRPIHKQKDVYERFAVEWAGHAIGELFRKAAAGIKV